MSRSRLFSIAAVLLALATAWVVSDELASLHRRAARLGEARPVLMATRDLAAGATIKAGDVDVRRVHEPADGALTDTAAAVGRVVAVPVLAGTPVLRKHLAPPGHEGLGALVPRGMRAVRVVAQPQWRLPAGSVVDVLTPDEPARTVAEGAVVLPGDGDVTLLVTVEAARRLASAAAAGPLTLALAPPEDACCTTSSSASSRD